MRRVGVVFSLLVVALLIGACTSGGGGGESGQEDESPVVGSLGSALDWDRSPDAVIVRLDTTGGPGDPSVDLNLIPFCTLFGNGRVVWLDPFTDPEQVLEARVDDRSIRAFLEYIIGSGFYSWEPGGDFELPTPVDRGPVLETITLTLYGETHSIDVRSNWPPGAWDRILERCQTLSDSPALYQPQGAWVSAVPVEMRTGVPSLPWSAVAESYPDVNLAAMTLENPRWGTGDFLQFAWDVVREGRLQITDNGVAYRLALQDPAIQPYAPPPPSEEGS